jgi:energy-coupling factor transport system ATP-binding protein
MIEFQNVCAGYDGAPVLHDVSFTINKGDFVAFVGTNGAGKSTTMRLANGLLKPTSGRVLVDGVPTTELKTSQIARRVGFLFQNPDRQICCNTVREELLFGFVAQGRAGAQADSAVDAMCERFGFDPAAEPFLLNRGARQLLALASIIVTEPDVVILDEPTTGLDFRECTAVMDVILAMNRAGTTVIMVCHDMEIVADYATRVIAMTAGRVVADGPCAQILRSADVAAEAHLEAPQVVQISTQLMQRQAHLRQTKIADANTVDELVRAIAEVRQNG